ncbi:MAG: type II restriction endonuclease, partial [Gemmatimonadetes bacterium]|nr:type II restriction endonuclease [Gemmatimonadota bacterium]
YHDPTFDSSLLVMLGAKSSCKERWRQILSEADRIDVKHLCTLESGISVNQTNEMSDSKVCLVIPSAVHSTFENEQLHAIMTVEEFIDKNKAMQTI